MPKRTSDPAAGSEATRPSKPSGSKGEELPRSMRPSKLKPSSTQASRRGKTNPKAIPSDDSNNHTPTSPHSFARQNEPATDEEASEGLNPESYSQLDAAEQQVVTMLKKITNRNERNHQKYDAFRDNISGKDKRIDELHASFEDLVSQTAGLGELCNSDVDAETLDNLFMAIPFQERQRYLGE